MDSPVRKMLKRNDYARHKLLRKIKRLRKARVELEKKAAEKELKKKLKIPRFDTGLNQEDDVTISTNKRGYLRVSGRPVPRPKNRDVDPDAYDKSHNMDAIRKDVRLINDNQSKIDALNSALDRAEKSERYHDEAMRVQEELNNMTKQPITSQLVQEAAKNQEEHKKDDFNESKHNWALIAKSIGAIGDAAALASVYGGFRAEKYLAKLMAERNSLLNSGKWGFAYDQRMNQLNSKIALINRDLNAPNYVQMFGGSLGATANGVQLGLGEGDLLDVIGAVGGISSLVGGAQILRGGGWGNKADSFIDKLGYGLQGIDLSKTMFEVPTGEDLLPTISYQFNQYDKGKNIRQLRF